MKNGADKVFIQFSDDTDLYFHTQAADLISDQEQHTARMREEFAGEILRAIITGALDAYKHRDGTLRIYEPSWTGPFCVRPQDVNDWLARKTQYQFRWNSVIHQEAVVSKAVPKADQTPALQTASLVEVLHPLSKDSRRRDLQPLIDDAQGRCPPRHNSCRLLRNQEHGDGDEGHLWHVTDNHSRTEL